MYNQINANKRKTWFLIASFLVFIGFLGYLFSTSFDYGYGALVVAAIFSLLMIIGSYYTGDKLALWTAHAVPVKKEEYPLLYRTVENLAITAGIPTPKVHVINDPAMNAFACGRDPQHASIAVTSGLMERLENEELEGVIAHELSHVKNYDIRVMTIVILLVGMIALLADWFLRFSFIGGRRRENGKNDLSAILFIVGIVLAILSPFIAQLIQLAVSRKREYLADASGALLTRYPEGLAMALEKISTSAQPLKSSNTATAHLYISNPFGGTRKFMGSLFSTHPPIEERIKRLRQMGG
jgi:heat shock protein HtpX